MSSRIAALFYELARAPPALAMARAAKRARNEGDAAALAFLARDSHMTVRGREALLRAVRDEGLPPAFSRSTQRRARAAIAGQATPYGPIMVDVPIKLANGKSFQCPMQSPIAMLHAAMQTSQSLASCFRAALAASPCTHHTPWRVVFYADEISPQNPLSVGTDRRKVHTTYWSFCEFGPELLSSEEMWFTLAVLRSELVKKQIKGGMSHVLKVLMNAFFKHGGHDLRNGVAMHAPSSRHEGASDAHMLFAKHGILLGDMNEIKEILLCKGHAGTKPCPCCRNVVDHKQGYADKSPALEPLTSLDSSKWSLHSDASVRALLAHLRVIAETSTNARLEAAQQHLGWNHCEENVLADEALGYRAISTLMYDWMHVYLVNGIFLNEVSQLMNRLKTLGITARTLHDYLQPWKWPRQFAHARNVFESGGFGGSASETLSCVLVLRKFVFEVVLSAADCQREAHSFLALCDVVENLRDCSREGSRVTPADLHGIIVAHLRLYQAVYGDQGWVFKHHQSLHLAGMMEFHGGLFACFLHERKHRTIQRFTKDRFSLVGHERGCME